MASSSSLPNHDTDPSTASPPPTMSPSKRAWPMDDIVVAAFAFLGLGGAVLLPVKFYIPPITISFLLATGLAALTYRYLGGIQNSSFSVGALKLGGALGALVGIALLINTRLQPQMPAPPKQFLVWEVSGQVTDDAGTPIEPLDTDDIKLKPPPLQPSVQGKFKLALHSWPDIEGRNAFPGLSISHNGYTPHPIDLNPNAINDVEITRNGQHIEIKRIALHALSKDYHPPQQKLQEVPYSAVTASAPTEPPK